MDEKIFNDWDPNTAVEAPSLQMPQMPQMSPYRLGGSSVAKNPIAAPVPQIADLMRLLEAQKDVALKTRAYALSEAEPSRPLTLAERLESLATAFVSRAEEIRKMAAILKEQPEFEKMLPFLKEAEKLV